MEPPGGHGGGGKGATCAGRQTGRRRCWRRKQLESRERRREACQCRNDPPTPGAPAPRPSQGRFFRPFWDHTAAPAVPSARPVRPRPYRTIDRVARPGRPRRRRAGSTPPAARAATAGLPAGSLRAGQEVLGADLLRGAAAEDGVVEAAAAGHLHQVGALPELHSDPRRLPKDPVHVDPAQPHEAGRRADEDAALPRPPVRLDAARPDEPRRGVPRHEVGDLQPGRRQPPRVEAHLVVVRAVRVGGREEPGVVGARARRGPLLPRAERLVGVHHGVEPGPEGEDHGRRVVLGDAGGCRM